MAHPENRAWHGPRGRRGRSAPDDPVLARRGAVENPGAVGTHFGSARERGSPRGSREHILAGERALGTVPTAKRIVLERFFDESGGMQLVVHALFGGRINRAFGLALRKRLCRSFGFELQAAANEEAIVLSLGTQHSFPLAEVFGYLKAVTARDVLVQALLMQPMSLLAGDGT